MTEKKLAGKRTSMLLVFMAVTTFLFQSCGEELKLDDMLPEYSGQPNEVYVFCDNVIWKDTVGAFPYRVIYKPFSLIIYFLSFGSLRTNICGER